MNILIVCSGNKGRVNPFITEQVDALRKAGVKAEYFIIKGKGVLGYLSNLASLRRKIRKGSYQLVHAHYGLSGLLSVMQRKVPVITTFHGSDIKKRNVLRLSRLAARFSAHNIVVEKSFRDLLSVIDKTSVIPCGVDFDTFYVTDRSVARAVFGYTDSQMLVLFTSSFENPVKNYALAKAAMELTTTRPLLIELKNYSRTQVNLLMNAADLLLMTSFSEGSPQVVKEALTCRLPVISVAVGDVPDLATQTDGISIVPYDPKAIAAVIDKRLKERKRVISNRMILLYDNREIAGQIENIYSAILKNS